MIKSESEVSAGL